MHSGGYLWGLDHQGRPLRLNASSDPQGDDYLDWINEAVYDADHEQIQIHKLVATKEHVIALDRRGYYYLYVSPSHTSIRIAVSTFENQRWYPGIGWSARTLPTDRGSFTDETGWLIQPLDSFELSSDGWKWEQPWMVDTSEQNYDKEGWQYAFNFGADVKFGNSQSLTSCVRRRRWVRTRRYTALCRWVQVSVENPWELFVDICAGGFDVNSDSSSDLYSLFALSTEGGLFWRKGIRKNCPDGTEWKLIEPIPDASQECEYHELASISCSASSGLLLAITWDGRLFFRVGISANCRCGTAWKSCPSPNNLPVVSATMGRRALWVLSSSGKLWMASVNGTALGISPDLSRCLFSDSFIAMGDGMCRVAVTRNDQVLGISQQNERMYIRSEVTSNELGGRNWLEIVARCGSTPEDELMWKQVDSGNCAIVSKRIPRQWIDSNFIAEDTSTLADLRSNWRSQINRLLDEQHELLWNVFQDLHSNETPREDRAWAKTARVHGVLDEWKSLNWIDANALLSLRGSDDGTLRVDFRRGRSIQIEFNQLLGVFTSCDGHWKNVLEVHSTEYSRMRLAFSSEDERHQWSDVLQKAISSYMRTLPRLAERSFCWNVGEQNQPRVAVLSSVALLDNHSIASIPLKNHRWTQQLGSFSSISVGSQGIVWAIAQNGTVWALSHDFDVVADDVDHGQELGLRQNDEKMEVILESQRYSILYGYASFNCKAAGKYYAWADATGTVSKTKTDTKLPNKHWNWVDPDWVLVPNGDSENSEEGWRYAKKFGLPFDEEKGSVRRREWRRLRAMEMRAPWVSVDSPQVSSVYVQKSDSEPVLVWACSTTGELLCRKGVTSQNPSGDFWEEVYSEVRVIDVSAPSNTCAWAISSNNGVVVRSSINPLDITIADWRPVDTPSSSGRLKRIEAGKASVWLLTECGKLLLRMGICDSNLFGTFWYEFTNEECVREMSVDKSDRLYALIANGDQQQCSLRRNSDFEFVNRIYALDKQKNKNKSKNKDVVSIDWERGASNMTSIALSVC